jgi:hypothetical protein
VREFGQAPRGRWEPPAGQPESVAAYCVDMDTARDVCEELGLMVGCTSLLVTWRGRPVLFKRPEHEQRRPLSGSLSAHLIGVLLKQVRLAIEEDKAGSGPLVVDLKQALEPRAASSPVDAARPVSA